MRETSRDGGPCGKPPGQRRVQRYPGSVEKSIAASRPASPDGYGPARTAGCAGVDGPRGFPVGSSPVPRSPGGWYDSLDWRRVVPFTNVSHETDIQTTESKEKEHPRIPRPNEHPGRPQDAVEAAEEGAPQAGSGGRLEVDGAAAAEPGPPTEVCFPPLRRIRRSGEIRGLLRRGKRRRTSELDVFLAASATSCARFGVIVPKHGHTIVDRNRLRRRLREIGRLEVLPRLDTHPRDLDFLVRARREAYQVSFQQLRNQLVKLTEELL